MEPDPEHRHRAAGIVAVQFVDEGSFVLAIGACGEFELLDVATGRLVASDTSRPLEAIVGFSARRAGDELFVSLRKQDKSPRWR